jgi:hypothetical protein
MNRRHLAALFTASAAASWMDMALADPVLNGFDLARASVPISAIERGGPPKDGIPAIDRPRFVNASAAKLADDDRVLGIALGDIARAYPVRTGSLQDKVGGQRLRIRYDRVHRTAEAVDEQGRPLAGVMAFWFAWVAFHPDTEVLSAP